MKDDLHDITLADVLRAHVGTVVHAGIQIHEALCFFDQRSQNRFDRQQWTANCEFR